MLTLPWIVCCLKYMAHHPLKFSGFKFHWNLLNLSDPTLLRSNWNFQRQSGLAVLRRSCQDSWRCLGDYGAGCGCQGFMKVGTLFGFVGESVLTFQGHQMFPYCLEGFAMISGESFGFKAVTSRFPLLRKISLSLSWIVEKIVRLNFILRFLHISGVCCQTSTYADD